jgi:hypothetical protein
MLDARFRGHDDSVSLNQAFETTSFQHKQESRRLGTKIDPLPEFDTV